MSLPLGGLRRAVFRRICHFYGGLRLPAGKHTGILTEIQTWDKEQMKKNILFNHGLR
jgi:hypothetical protein